MRKNAAIACQRMKGHHTYDVIAKALVQVMDKYKIRKKTKDAVTDSGSNFSKSFRVYAGILDPSEEDEVSEEEDSDMSETEETDEPQPADLFGILENEGADLRLPAHMKCTCHKLNNIASKDIDEALKNAINKEHSRSAMQKAKALFKKQKNSTLAADHIRANCKGKLFIIPNATRWNSLYDAVKRLVKIIDDSDDSLNALMDLLGIDRFTEDDLTFLREYLQVYKHFADVLDLLQGEKNAFIGSVLPLLSGLSKKLVEESHKVTMCAPLADALLAGINKRFWDEFRNDRLYVASAVHPRFKTIWIDDPEKRATVWQLVRDDLQMLKEANATTRTSDGASVGNSPVVETPAQNVQSATGEVDTMDSLVPMGRQETPADATLLDVYMTQPTSKDLSALDTFPLIKQLFIMKNTLLPSSAPSEESIYIHYFYSVSCSSRHVYILNSTFHNNS